MCTSRLVGRVCKKLYQIPTRVIGTLLTITQGILLNFFLAQHFGVLWHCWIIADAVIVAVFISAYVISYRMDKHAETSGILQHRYPLVFITWAVYAVGYISRVAVIYTQFVWLLPPSGFGPNLLRFTMSLSAPIFFLLLTAHYGHESKKQYIELLTGTVVLDLLDSVQILDVLIIQESRVLLPLQLDHGILAISCIDFMIPVVPLFTLNLNESRPESKKISSRLLMLHKLVHMFVINVPLMGLRLFLWHGTGHDISVFLMKNILMIYLTLQSLVEHFWKNEIKPKMKPKEGESIEMQA